MHFQYVPMEREGIVHACFLPTSPTVHMIYLKRSYVGESTYRAARTEHLQYLIPESFVICTPIRSPLVRMAIQPAPRTIDHFLFVLLAISLLPKQIAFTVLPIPFRTRHNYNARSLIKDPSAHTTN